MIKNKKSDAFIFIEVILSTALSAILLLTLASVLYLMFEFSVKQIYILTARQRAQRVIAHLDSRIRNCGYGLWNCQVNGSYDKRFSEIPEDKDKLRRALGMANSDNVSSPQFSIYRQPLVVFSNHISNITANEDVDVEFFENRFQNEYIRRGNSFAFFYTLPAKNSLVLSINEDIDEKKYILSSKDTEIDYKEVYKDIFNEDTGFKGISSTFNLQSWGVVPSVGMPFYITKYGSRNDKKIKLTLSNTVNYSVIMTPVCEAMPLKGEMFFVNEVTNNFHYREMENIWGASYPYEDGILRIYCEYRRRQKIFDLWILSSGGTKPASMIPTIPDWPENDKNGEGKAKVIEYSKEHILYVTRASWKLYNLL